MIVHEMENELIKIWNLTLALSDQLQENRAITAQLRAQADILKTKALHSGTGLPLRRFNLDLSQEAYNAELEKTNGSVLAENQNLLNENKQLNALVREYEQTLETIMSKFRTHAHASQEHELTLTRKYERQLLNHETTVTQQELSQTMAISVALGNISTLLRQTLRATGGEAPSSGSSDDEDYLFPGKQSQEAWSLERDCELVRLQRENEHLQALVAVEQSDTSTIDSELAAIAEAVRLKWTQNISAHVEEMDDGQSHGQAYGSLLQLGGPRRAMGLGRGKPKAFGMGNTNPW